MNNQSPQNPSRPWRPTPLLWLSFALHGSALLVFTWQPHLWPWLLALVAINQLVLTLTGLWPRSHGLGPNWTHLPAAATKARQVAITIDDGPDPAVTPAVLDLLDQYQAKATFFCIGEQAEHHPELCREIVMRGHAVENHSQHHLNYFAALGPHRMAAEILAAQETLTRITGQRPLFFRAIAGLRSPLLEPILSRNGLTLATWTRRGFDTVRTDPSEVSALLTRHLSAGDILLLHDGHAARSHTGQPVSLAVLPRLLEAITAANLETVTLRSAYELSNQ